MRSCAHGGSLSNARNRRKRGQPNRYGKGIWDSEQLYCRLVNTHASRVASQVRLPAEMNVSALRTREDRRYSYSRRGSGWWWKHAHLNALMAKHLYADLSVLSAAPVPRSRSGAEPTASGWSSTLTRRSFFVLLTIPLALFTQRARTTTANAGFHTPYGDSHRRIARCS